MAFQLYVEDLEGKVLEAALALDTGTGFVVLGFRSGGTTTGSDSGHKGGRWIYLPGGKDDAWVRAWVIRLPGWRATNPVPMLRSRTQCDHVTQGPCPIHIQNAHLQSVVTITLQSSLVYNSLVQSSLG